jgi:hypothetical protein
MDDLILHSISRMLLINFLFTLLSFKLKVLLTCALNGLFILLGNYHG